MYNTSFCILPSRYPICEAKMAHQHTTQEDHTQHGAPATPPSSSRSLAFKATVHCLTGCGIGEVLGLAIATALGWHDLPSIALAIVLAFAFGYGLTMQPLLGAGIP